MIGREEGVLSFAKCLPRCMLFKVPFKVLCGKGKKELSNYHDKMEEVIREDWIGARIECQEGLVHVLCHQRVIKFDNC